MIRLSGICCHDNETTVLAHVRQSGISGMGIKSPDIFASFACWKCHAAVDGQTEQWMTEDERDLALLRGMVRTQNYWIKQGIVKW